jgi:hypothetical protein
MVENIECINIQKAAKKHNRTPNQILNRNITTSNEHKFYQFIKYKTKNK